MGQLSGEYRIRIDPNAQLVQHVPRRVAVALRAKLRETLEDLVEQDVIEQVKTPTPWISSVVVVPKKNGKLRVCLDPKDLNNAIQRENYPLPTIEEIATRLMHSRIKQGSASRVCFTCANTRGNKIRSDRERTFVDCVYL